MDDAKQPGPRQVSGNPSPELERNSEVEEFFKRLVEKQGLRRPKPGDEAIAAALQAIQRLGAAQSIKEQPAIQPTDDFSAEGLPVCRSCGHHNQIENQFCGMCGAPLSQSQVPGPGKGSAVEGQHTYHHHYHHHYLEGAGAELVAGALGQRSAPAVPKDPVRGRPSAGAPGLSRAEAALRQMTQDWALACNNKQLDDLLTFYGTDALVLRPNLPAIRGTSAIREFFFSALDSGLGDVEMEPFRVEVLGDLAYETGRCKMLVPLAVGKRREDRGKYVVVFSRQKTGEWKAVVDSWSSDLNLNVAADAPPAKSAVPASPASTPKIRR
jgi:ketosteroid isomerase-like protein